MADPKIKYDIEANVSGNAEVDKLALRIEQLADTLDGDLKTSALESAAALRQLGQKDGAVQNFIDLKRQATDAAAGLKDAQAAAQKMGAELANVEKPTRAQSGALQKLRDTVRDAKTEVQAKTAALIAARSGLDQYGISTDNLGQSQRNIKTAIAAAKVEVQAMAPAWQNAAAAMDQVNQANLQAKAAMDSIANAFRTVGVRSAQELEAEIVDVRQAMDLLKNNAGLTGSTLSTAFATGEAKIKGLERQLRETNGTLTLGDKTAKLFANSLGQISAGNIIADGVGYLVTKVKELGAAFLGTIVQGEQLKRGLNAVYKDAVITAQQIDFLRKSSSESGVAFGSLSNEFVKFTASMKMSNIPMAQSNELFRAVTAASASLGLGAEATAGTLNALGQMASKGTVSLEELRAQLGDRLPGALGLTASGLGITEGQLIKLVTSGQLATRDFVVPFTQALGKLKGETDGLVPTWERFKGVLTQTAQAMGDAGFTTILTAGLKTLVVVVGTLGNVLLKTVEGLMLLSSGAMAVSAAIAGDRKALDKWQQKISESGTRMAALDEALGRAVFGADSHATATTAATQAMTSNTAAVTKAIAANTQLDGSQKLAALSTALAADATLDAAAKSVQYNVAAAELLKSQAGQTDAFNKLAKAAKEQGVTLVENAKLTGDSTTIHMAGLQAAQLYADAIDKATASQSLETAVLVAQKAELEKSATARGLTALQIKTQIDELDKLILASKAETEQSTQAQAAARAEVTSRQLVAAALLDNSTRLDAYAQAMTAAQREVERLKVLEAKGLATKDQLAVAQGQLATATYMYRDAVTDLTGKIELETKVKSANLQLSIAQATASQNHFTALANEARASGDVALAVQYEVKAKEESIRVLKLKLELDKLQQQADLLIIEAKRKLINTETEEGQQKLKLLDIETQMIKVKAAGNQAILDQIRALERQNTELRNNYGAMGSGSGTLNRDTNDRHKNAGAINKQADALERLTSDGLKANRDGSAAGTFGNAVPLDQANRLRDATKSGQAINMTSAELAAAKKQATDAYEYIMAMARATPGLVLTQSINDAQALVNAANTARVNITDKPAPAPSNPSPTTAAKTTPDFNAAKAAKTYTVNIIDSGQLRQYSASTDADAQALIKQLQSAKRSSGY